MNKSLDAPDYKSVAIVLEVTPAAWETLETAAAVLHVAILDLVARAVEDRVNLLRWLLDQCVPEDLTR